MFRHDLRINGRRLKNTLEEMARIGALETLRTIDENNIETERSICHCKRKHLYFPPLLSQYLLLWQSVSPCVFHDTFPP